LLALLSDSRAGAVQTLEQLRTTPAPIKRQLDQIWSAAVVPVPDMGEVHLTSRNRPDSTA
jgi:hypothetical protein